MHITWMLHLMTLEVGNWIDGEYKRIWSVIVENKCLWVCEYACVYLSLKGL